MERVALFKDLKTITLKRETKLNSDYSLNGTLIAAGTTLYTIEQPYDQKKDKVQNWFPGGRWLLCHSWKWKGTSKAALCPAWTRATGIANSSVLIHYANNDSSFNLEGCSGDESESEQRGYFGQ